MTKETEQGDAPDMISLLKELILEVKKINETMEFMKHTLIDIEVLLEEE